MTLWIVPPLPGLIEPAAALEIFADEIGAIERVGTNLRIYFCTRQRLVEDMTAPAQPIVVLKVVRPIENIPSSIVRFAQTLVSNENAAAAGHHVGPWEPHLVPK